MEISPDSWREVLAHLLRNTRRALRRNQRELATELSLSKSQLGRLESGTGDPPFSVVLGVLQQLEIQVHLGVHTDNFRVGAWSGPPDVLDAAGRRLPAHLDAYHNRFPHRWWFVRSRDVAGPWPTWPFRRRQP